MKKQSTSAATARPDRDPMSTALDRLEVVPSTPRGLSTAAKIEWDWLARATVGTGVLRECDVRALVLLAETLATESTLRKTIAREGMTIAGGRGVRKQHPALSALASCQSRAAKMLESFGLTPVSRKNVDTRPPPKPPNPFDEYQ